MGLYSDLKFDTGTYIPQYAGAPLAELKETADTLSTRHYQNLAQANSLDILAHQLKANLLPGARSYVDQHISALDESLREMATYGGENSTARVNALAAALKGDEKLIRAGERSKEYSEQTKLIDALKAKGETPLFNKQRRAALEQATADSDVYNLPYASAVEPYRNPEPEMEDIWKVVNPDSIEGEMKVAIRANQAFDPTFKAGDPALFFETITRGGIANEKIKGMLEGAWANYKNTPSYKQQTGELVGKPEEQLKREFFQKGLMRVYTDLKREYNQTPAWSGRLAGGAGGKETGVPILAPGRTFETNIPYNPDGLDKAANIKVGTATTVGPMGAFVGGGEGTTYNSSTEMHPQAKKDLATAKEVFGPQATLKDYTNLIKKRVEHTWALTVPTDVAKMVSDHLQREYTTVEYMDPATGEVIRPTDESGQMSKKFMELTGGKPDSFEVGFRYDAKNHFTTYPGSNEKFSTPFSVNGKDKDGNTKTFIVSTKPGMFTTSPIETNTNVIYTTANTRPGQETDLGHGIKVQELYGEQLNQLSEDQKRRATFPIVAVIPGYENGEHRFYASPEELAQTLADLNIYLNPKK